MPEVAVGSDHGHYVEELAGYDDEPDDRGDEYAEFDDDDGYEPSHVVQMPKKVSMT